MSHIEERLTDSGYLAAPGIGSQGDDKYGFIDKDGNMIIRPQFDKVCSFTDGLAKVAIDGKCGFIDRNGNMLFEPWLEAEENFFVYDMNSFSCDLAKVSVDGKFGYIDRSGKLVIPAIYDDATAFDDGMAFVKKEEVPGFINKTGEMIISNDLYEIYDYGFLDGLCCITIIDGKYGCIDTTGKIAIPPISEAPLFFSEGMSAVKINGKCGYIDMKGNICIKPAFDEASSFSEGLASVMVGGKLGYIDKWGNIVISARFDREFTSFQGGRAVVMKDCEDLIINKTGEILFRYGNKFAIGYKGYPQDKLQPAHANGNIFLIKTFGEVVVQLDDYSPVDSDVFSFKKNDRWGLMDYGGNIIIQPVFMGYFDFYEGLAKVETESGKQEYIDMKGQFVIEPQYWFSEGLAAVCISSVQRNNLSRRETGLKYWICERAKKLKK